MEKEYERLAEDFAELYLLVGELVTEILLKILEGTPLIKWLPTYLEEHGFTTDGYLKDIMRCHDELKSLPPDDQEVVTELVKNKMMGKSIKFETMTREILERKSRERSPVYKCDDCHSLFTIPGVDFDKATCPGCGKQWTKGQLEKLKES